MSTDGQPLFQTDFMTLLDRLPECVTVTDTGGVILYVNPYAAAHMYGQGSEHVVGRLVQSFVPGSLREAAEHRLRELREMPLELELVAVPHASGDTEVEHWAIVRDDGVTVDIEGRTRKVRAGVQVLFIGAYHLSLASLVAQNSEHLAITEGQVAALIDEQADTRRAIDDVVTHIAMMTGELESLWVELGRHADIIDAQGTVAKRIKASDMEPSFDPEPDERP